MYYRRKILLSLLQLFDNKLEKLQLQKYLFLLSQSQSKSDFQFVPYKFGGFSFQANADLFTMTKYEQVEQDDSHWTKTDKFDYLSSLKIEDRKLLINIKNKFGNYSTEDLIKYTYVNFPYYAINSTISKSILNKDQLAEIEKIRPHQDETVLYTIGYEGLSLEEYLNILLINNVRVLCDVRRNPLSMKYGFHKSQLKNACEGVGIKYMHIPELGIDSSYRQNLDNQNDYDKLFKIYKSDILPKSEVHQQIIFKELLKNKRIALTCFEADFNQCHRKYLAESIAKIEGFNYKIKHLNNGSDKSFNHSKNLSQSIPEI